MDKQKLIYKWVVSGNWTWKHPSGRISKDVVVCSDRQQAMRIMDGMERDHTKHVSYRYIHEKKDIPYFSPSKYEVTWRNAEDCPHWLR